MLALLREQTAQSAHENTGTTAEAYTGPEKIAEPFIGSCS
jgi:hypothetical protein